MTNTAEVTEDLESERPTLIPPSRTPGAEAAVDTSDVDATWPDEAPRHSFIGPKSELSAAPSVPEKTTQDESGTFLMPTPESAALAPPLDQYEDDRTLLVLIDLPGVAPDSLSIHLSNVAIHVSASIPDDPRRQTPLRTGRQEVTIEVPRGTEAEAVDASLRNGVLRIRVDKSGATTRHVDIAHSDSAAPDSQRQVPESVRVPEFSGS